MSELDQNTVRWRYMPLHQPACVTHLLELTKKSHFKLTLGMIIGLERLKNFVQPLILKSPEVVKRPEIAHIFADMCCVVVIGFDYPRSIKLDSKVNTTSATKGYGTYRNDF